MSSGSDIEPTNAADTKLMAPFAATPTIYELRSKATVAIAKLRCSHTAAILFPLIVWLRLQIMAVFFAYFRVAMRPP